MKFAFTTLNGATIIIESAHIYLLQDNANARYFVCSVSTDLQWQVSCEEFTKITDLFPYTVFE